MTRRAVVVLVAVVGLSACSERDARVSALVSEVRGDAVCVVPEDQQTQPAPIGCFPYPADEPRLAVGDCISARFPLGKDGLSRVNPCTTCGCWIEPATSGDEWAA
jgi:hypothetical protein